MKLDKLIALSFIGLLLYLGWSYGMPYLQQRIEGAPGGRISGMGEGAMCARKVQRTGLELRKRTRSFEGAEDETKALATLDIVDSLVVESRRECNCSGDACRTGRKALDSLKQATATYKRRVLKGDYAQPDLREFDRLVEEAALIARSESPI